MPALVSTPVVAYSTTAAWISAPAIGASDFAWLETPREGGDVRVVASFRGDRLIVRAGGANVTAVDQPCTTTPCGTVQAPVANGDGSFGYAVAFPGTGGYVANASAAGVSTVVAEDQTDPHDIVAPHPVASAGATLVWVDNGQILSAPTAGGAAATLVTAEQAGGTITSIAAGAAGGAWAAHLEDITGTVRPGLMADLVLVDGDIESIPPLGIGATGIALTVCGGRITHQAPGFA